MSEYKIQEAIARTGYLTSVFSYLVFWLVDIVRPGFVARYLSVHLFLLGAIVFGTWWLCVVGGEWRERPVVLYGTSILLGALLSACVWQNGTGLEEYRILMTVLAAFVPPLCLRLLLTHD